jgi:hypothetical protein
MWPVRTTKEFNEWYADLDDDGKEEIIAKVEILKLFGPALGRPHVDTLNGSKHSNMKELRANTADQVLRVAFAFDPNRAGILLVAGDKAGVGQKRFYRQLIAKADVLYDIHLAKIKAAKYGKETK